MPTNTSVLFDPMSSAFARDPYRVYAELRQNDNPYYFEDHDMWLRISEETDLVCCNDSITYVRKHEGPRISTINNGLTQLGDALTSICCAYARLLGIEEPINLSNSDFDKFQIEKDKVLNKFHFYEFFLFVKWIKNIFTFDKYFR